MPLPLESRKHLFDVVAAAEAVARFIAGRTEDDYLNDEYLRSAVERKYAIIGEAITRLLKGDPATAGKLTEYRRIVGFRNQLVHAYDIIDHQVVWRITQEKMPILLREAKALLAEPRAEPPPTDRGND